MMRFRTTSLAYAFLEPWPSLRRAMPPTWATSPTAPRSVTCLVYQAKLTGSKKKKEGDLSGEDIDHAHGIAVPHHHHGGLWGVVVNTDGGDGGEDGVAQHIQPGLLLLVRRVSVPKHTTGKTKKGPAAGRGTRPWPC